MRCLTTIMMFDLYPVRKLTTINNARAIFLVELKEKTFIDISSLIFDIIVDETWTTSRPKLIFPSLFKILALCLHLQPSIRWPSSGYKFVFQVMKRRVTTEKVIQWKLKQRLQDRPSHPEVEARGAGLQPHQMYLQMHFRSSWKGLMDLERSRMSILTRWQKFKINSTYF